MMTKNKNNILGWMLLFALILAFYTVSRVSFNSIQGYDFIIGLGVVGIWRYGVGLTHFLRGIIFLKIVYPRVRRDAKKNFDKPPSHVYLMVTSFRIDPLTTYNVYDSVINEAINCGFDVSVVCSIVERSDELLIKKLWEVKNPPDRIKLIFVRIPGTGKRDGLANGFRAISRCMPDDNAIVAVIDGDTMLVDGVIRDCFPYFNRFPNLGALTTNELCRVKGNYLISQWHKLRFAQRHINMCSMALSKRVLTLTGRMSVFRASIVTNKIFINDVENDYLCHWRLGRFKFLTGDDKSSWFSLMRLGYDTWYVPSSKIVTIEHPPDKNIFKASAKLMFRWYGNSLRQNYRATKLGVSRLGIFTYYVLLDQRISMWTSIFGVGCFIYASIKYTYVFIIFYGFWILMTRTLYSLMLYFSGHKLSPIFPVVLFYNQIFGSIVKIYASFRLDRQSWTRQKTKFSKNGREVSNRYSSRLMTASAFMLYFLVIFLFV